jgi:hypothetical protein
MPCLLPFGTLRIVGVDYRNRITLLLAPKNNKKAGAACVLLMTLKIT